MTLADTIVAPATGTGQAAVAVVRISGPLCREIIAAALGAPSPPLPRRSTLANYAAVDGAVVDHLLYTYYPAPNSYTGEDLLELSCHGNPFIIRRIIDDLCARGCRMAEPGEFTRVAFLNGKMDLSQAEAVAEVIRVQCDAALVAAQRQLGGALAQRVSALSDEILTLLANLEAYIDFPDEDLPAESVDGPLQAIARLQHSMELMAATGEYRERLIDGWSVAILGAPNAGKSSLLNALLGESRALVSAEPGTTRDYIREAVRIGRYGVHLVDTAGLRSTTGAVERMGMECSMELAKSADLVVWVLDRSAPPPCLPHGLGGLLEPKRTIVVENKADLPKIDDIADFLADCQRVETSVLAETGLDVLRGTIERWIDHRGASAHAEDLLVSRRHAECLRGAVRSLGVAADLLKSAGSTELAATEVRQAVSSLEAIVGRFDNEAMLDRLFANFCIGK